MSAFGPPGLGPAPPVLPPKPGSQDASRRGTPAEASSSSPYRPEPSDAEARSSAGPNLSSIAPIPDPGDLWLPQVLQDKSKQDLVEILSSPTLLEALAHSPVSIHPSLSHSHAALHSALASNIALAQQLEDLEARLSTLRSTTQARLLATHALERQWRNKQSEMDAALAGFSPAGLYQLLARGVAEQGLVCEAMEDSFLGAGEEEGGQTGEREAGEWIRRYREARVQYYLRQERKERWDEGRVGGWR